VKSKKDISKSSTALAYAMQQTYSTAGTLTETKSVAAGVDQYQRTLTRSVGLWKPGQGRKPQQPYTNTEAMLHVPRGTVNAYVKSGSREYRMSFSGAIGMTFIQGFDGSMVPSAFGGSVKSFPMFHHKGVNPDLLSQAEVKCYNKLDQFSPEREQKVDVSVAVGERRETARLLKDCALGILNLAKVVSGFSSRSGRWEFGLADAMRESFGVNVHPAELRRRYRRRLQKLSGPRKSEILKGALTASLVADLWLTYKLAYTPLMSELGNAISAVTQKVADRDAYTYTVSARHYVQRGSMATRPIDYRSSGVQEFYVTELHGYTVTFVAAPSKRDMDRMAQLGLDNPLATAYELTTLSFVLDYFVNLGNFLEALNVPKRFEFIDGSWTQRIVRQYSTVFIGPEAKARGHASLDHTQRKVYSTFPVPIPPLSLSDRDLTAAQFLTLASLAVVKIRKLFGGG